VDSNDERLEPEFGAGAAQGDAPDRSVVWADGLAKSFDGVNAVNGLSFAVERGEIFGLLGPNGAGKTTTIRMIMDILRPDAGEVRVLGVPPAQARERVGYLPEDRGLYSSQGVLETLVYLARLKGRTKAQAEAGARMWLDRVNLADRAGSKIEDLSHGMRQKIQLVASLVHEPDLVILDEPFSGLDPVNVEVVKDEIKRLAHEGTTVVLSAHQMNLVEALCDRIVLVNRGRAVLYGQLEEIKRSYAGRAVRVKAAGPLPAVPGTHVAVQRDGVVTLSLDTSTPGDVLRTLVNSGIDIESWEVASAPLEDVFLAVVGAPGQPPAPAAGPPEPATTPPPEMTTAS
jgi:ABC-2 type transport system ATP-binding protein